MHIKYFLEHFSTYFSINISEILKKIYGGYQLHIFFQYFFNISQYLFFFARLYTKNAFVLEKKISKSSTKNIKKYHLKCTKTTTIGSVIGKKLW